MHEARIFLLKFRGITVKCCILRTFQRFFFIISSRSRFYKIKKAVNKPVVRRPINLSEFFLHDFEMFIKKKIGWTINEF